MHVQPALMQGEDTCTVWVVFGQHLGDSHDQARLVPSHTEIGEIIQTLVSQCPPWGSGHMTSVQDRIRTTKLFPVDHQNLKYMYLTSIISIVFDYTVYMYLCVIYLQIP